MVSKALLFFPLHRGDLMKYIITNFIRLFTSIFVQIKKKS